ncbi:hypothetical protein Cni_G27421 [Canna indica]|uniref:CCHC-type domain-containing protein n=1 Tax=Canna indica TaxID=4628 RepID=A0AAQ3L1R3_9LILI|nr:hypothetical protein Cni_G27421 [Canna indica]
MAYFQSLLLAFTLRWHEQLEEEDAEAKRSFAEEDEDNEANFCLLSPILRKLLPSTISNRALPPEFLFSSLGGSAGARQHSAQSTAQVQTLHDLCPHQLAVVHHRSTVAPPADSPQPPSSVAPLHTHLTTPPCKLALIACHQHTISSGRFASKEDLLDAPSSPVAELLAHVLLPPLHLQYFKCCSIQNVKGRKSSQCREPRTCFICRRSGHQANGCRTRIVTPPATSSAIPGNGGASSGTPPPPVVANLCPLSVAERCDTRNRPETIDLFLPPSDQTISRAGYLAERCVLVSVQGSLGGSEDIAGFLASDLHDEEVHRRWWKQRRISANHFIVTTPAGLPEALIQKALVPEALIQKALVPKALIPKALVQR